MIALRARLVPALAAGAALVLTAATPAVAESPAAVSAPGPSVLVSTDGAHFAPALAAGLFDFAGPLIPGGSAATSLFVKNPSDRPMLLSLGATDIAFSNREFADALSVIVTSESPTGRSATARPLTLGTAAQCGVLLTGERLGANGTARIDLALAMADVTGRVAQGQSATFNVHVSLWDAAAPPPTDACDSPGVNLPGLSSPGGDGTQGSQTQGTQTQGTQTQAASSAAGLAHTGSDAWPPLLLGTGLLGAGLALLLARRRRRRA